ATSQIGPLVRELRKLARRALWRLGAGYHGLRMTSMPRWKRLVLGGLERLGVTPTVVEFRDRLNYRRDRAAQERNAAFQAPDGLPLPAPEMVHKVVGHFDLKVFTRAARTATGTSGRCCNKPARIPMRRVRCLTGAVA